MSCVRCKVNHQVLFAQELDGILRIENPRIDTISPWWKVGQESNVNAQRQGLIRLYILVEVVMSITPIRRSTPSGVQLPDNLDFRMRREYRE